VEEVRNFLDKGADEVFEKPLNLNLLKAAIKSKLDAAPTDPDPTSSYVVEKGKLGIENEIEGKMEE
jgi:DNA-binding response OmpR family regulator